MANFIEVAGGGLIGGNSIAGLGTLSSAGVATAINLPKAEFYYAEETVTCASTSVATTMNLVQANSLILFCGAKVGTAITGGVSSMSVAVTSDTTNSLLISDFGAFTAGYEAVAVGTMWDASRNNGAAGPFYTAASTLTLQWSTAATGGTVRLWVYGIKFSNPV